MVIKIANVGNIIGTEKEYLNFQSQEGSGAPRPGKVVRRGVVGSREAKNIP